jgi:TPR repeat protein
MGVRDALHRAGRAGLTLLCAAALASCALSPAAEEAELQRRVADLQRQLEDARAALAAARTQRGAPPEAAAPVRRSIDSSALYQQALESEAAGRYADAARLYRLSARHGNGRAAQRLGEILGKGLPGVDLNYGESLKWLNTARVLGEDAAPAR